MDGQKQYAWSVIVMMPLVDTARLISGLADTQEDTYLFTDSSDDLLFSAAQDMARVRASYFEQWGDGGEEIYQYGFRYIVFRQQELDWPVDEIVEVVREHMLEIVTGKK